jgi:DNA-binding transcriptional regulator YiaG
MQFNATPQTLAQLDQVPLYKFGTALNMLDNMQSADQQTLADLPNSIAHEQAMRPMRQEQLSIGNQQGLAQLPGMRAQSSMQQRKNQEEDLFTPERHAEFYAKHGAEKMKQYASQLVDSGTVALSAASMAAKLPIGGTNAAKQMFAEANVKWHPEWDNLPVPQLVERLQDLGQEMSTNGAKSQTMIAQMQMKDEIARKTEEERTRRALEVEAMRQRMKLQISELVTTAKSSNNKETMQQAWTRLQAELRGTSDPALQQYLSEKIQEVFTAMERLQVNNKPTINPAVAPNVLQPGQQGSPAVVQPPAAGASAPPKDPYAGFTIKPR